MESPTKSGKLSYSRKVADIVKNIHHSFQKDYNNSFFANFPFSHPLKMSGYLYSSKVLRGHRSRTLALNRLNIGSEHTRWKGVITEKVEEGRKRFFFYVMFFLVIFLALFLVLMTMLVLITVCWLLSCMLINSTFYLLAVPILISQIANDGQIDIDSWIDNLFDVPNSVWYWRKTSRRVSPCDD